MLEAVYVLPALKLIVAVALPGPEKLTVVKSTVQGLPVQSVPETMVLAGP